MLENLRLGSTSGPMTLTPVETENQPRADSSAVSSAPTGAIDTPPGSRAVIYLRVSSKGQVKTDYDPEGISIPAQRTSCERKAEALGLTIVHEYIEPGRSATEMTKRVAFQEMLERIRPDRDVDYVIVYKLFRFARNRTDDAIIMADLQKRRVTLISTTEQDLCHPGRAAYAWHPGRLQRVPLPLGRCRHRLQDEKQGYERRHAGTRAHQLSQCHREHRRAEDQHRPDRSRTRAVRETRVRAVREQGQDLR